VRAWLLAAAPAALACLACKGDNAQSVQPELFPPDASYDFGTVPVLNSRQLDIPFQNVGGASLTLDSVTLDAGSDAGGIFAIVAAPTLIESGATLPVSITFTPPALQSYSAQLIVTSEDIVHPSVTVSLTGKGSTEATMALMPSSLDFGRVNEGTSAVQTLDVLAGGTAALELTQLGFTPGTPASFSFLTSASTPAFLDAGDQLELAVKYYAAPGSLTGADGGITVEGTDPNNRSAVVPMSAGLNRAPVPVISPLGNGAPGITVTLNGTGSYDPDGDYPLTYQWTLANAPLSATTQIAQPTLPITQMTLDATLPGEYDVLLDVTDSAGAKDLQPAKATIVAVPAQKLLIELFQDNPDTDLDIHFLETQTTMLGSTPGDCFYGDPDPLWSLDGGVVDAGPQMVKDALTGYGPNITAYGEPIDSTFRVVVGFTNAHFATNPATTATVRIYVYGVEQAQVSQILEQQGDYWQAADISWPSGTVTPL
jgi:hypothetical protein